MSSPHSDLMLSMWVGLTERNRFLCKEIKSFVFLPYGLKKELTKNVFKELKSCVPGFDDLCGDCCLSPTGCANVHDLMMLFMDGVVFFLGFFTL